MNKTFSLAILILALLTSCGTKHNISGTRTKWQPVTITFAGSELKEESSTFRDYRLNITFTNGEKSYTVPGYFSADGDAANTSASVGNKWRVVFTPDKSGQWTYKVSFRKGKDIAASRNENEGEPSDFDGQTGSFSIAEADANAPGFYAKGKLLYVGEHYLQCSESKEWFVKSGPGGPENFLGYIDFDSTYNVPGGVNDSALGADGLHKYAPHLNDWKVGDPTWKNGKGKAIVGAVNYLASKGLNSFYFVMNGVEGDGRDCWPWTNYEARDVYDVSKLDQWNILFQHMNAKGIELDFLFWEAENTKLLNGGDLGIERRIYYRELIARFGHLPAIRWNISEEPTTTSQQIIADAEYIHAIDPYGHAIGSECGYTVERRNAEYPPLMGRKDYIGAWMQCHADHHNEVIKYLNKADSAGVKWVVGVDESSPNHPQDIAKVRKEFWEVVTAGGEGFLVYFGYGTGTSDIANEDFRNRDTSWTQLATGIALFKMKEINANLPQTKNHDELGSGHILALPGETYIIYLQGEKATLDLTDESGNFNIAWIDPSKTLQLQKGSLESVAGGALQSLGNPPSNSGDWVVWVQKQ